METFLDAHTTHAMGILLGAAVVAIVAETVLMRLVHRFTSRTRNRVDDQVVAVVRVPVVLSIVIIGAWYAILHLQFNEAVRHTSGDILLTASVLVWTVTGIRLVGVIVDALVKQPGQAGLVQVTTRPLISIAGKVVVLGAGVYFLLLTWEIDISAWLASAGIVGIAMGFAAQDSLANLFAGLSILADRPFKVGDFLVLNGGTRGRVTTIGLRSTRILTQDDMEIVVPNSTMANATITNESGGPYEKERVRLPVGVSYASDIDHVRAVLEQIANTVVPGDIALDDPRTMPRVHFVAFGESSLDLELLVWIHRPELLSTVRDALNTAIFKRFAAEGIEIPYPKRDLYLRQTVADQKPRGSGVS